MTEELQPSKKVFSNIAANERKTADRLERLRALAEMHATPKSSRKALGLPLTDKAFADHWDVVPGRISKDKQTAEYKKFLAEAEEAQARKLDPRGTAAMSQTKLADLANNDLATYEQIKGQVAQDAMAGDVKALELWLKTWGTPFVQEEVNRVDAVSNLDDRELIEEIIELVDVNLLISIIKDRGLI